MANVWYNPEAPPGFVLRRSTREKEVEVHGSSDGSRATYQLRYTLAEYVSAAPARFWIEALEVRDQRGEHPHVPDEDRERLVASLITSEMLELHPSLREKIAQNVASTDTTPTASRRNSDDMLLCER